MLKDFIVNVARETTPISEAGFGLVLIANTGATAPQALLGYKVYSNLVELAVDYPAGVVNNMATTLFAQEPTPRKVAVVSAEGALGTDLTTLLNGVADKDFFGLVITNNALLDQASAWVDANDRVFAVTTESVATVKDSPNVLLAYSDDIDDKNYIAEALLQHLLLRPIGSTTGKARRLRNIDAVEISSTDLDTLETNNALTYVVKQGIAQTTEGKAGNGEYFDIVLGAYFLEVRIEEGLANLLVNTPKIPYSNAGISQLASVVQKVLNQGVAQGIILEDDDGNGVYNISYVTREDTPTADISNRIYNGLTWTATVAGAIHGGEIQGALVL